jgi:ABC-type Fe3+/spermidine/putrescine transport system ATPase subunit
LRTQRQLGLTTIHVSHNLEEAFSVADRAAILYQGVIQQVGSLDELLRRPNTEFVARFMRCENIYSGELISASANGCRARVKDGIEFHVPGQHQGKIKFVIRPEDVLVFPRSSHNGLAIPGRDPKCENEFDANLVRWRDCGGYIRLELDGPLSMIAHVTHAAFAGLKPDSNKGVNVALPLMSIHVLRQ